MCKRISKTRPTDERAICEVMRWDVTHAVHKSCFCQWQRQRGTEAVVAVLCVGGSSSSAHQVIAEATSQVEIAPVASSRDGAAYAVRRVWRRLLFSPSVATTPRRR